MARNNLGHCCLSLLLRRQWTTIPLVPKVVSMITIWCVAPDNHVVISSGIAD